MGTVTNEQWDRVEQLFATLSELPEPARVRELASIADEEVRREVASLLSHAGPGDVVADAIGAMAAELPVSGRDLTGRTLGPYRVRALIERGGMGEVYEAEDSRLGRRVALKLLPEFDGRDSGRVRRFQLEARAASALNHPNIVTIFDVGQAEGVFYIATELVVGKTLRQLMAQGPAPLKDVVAIGLQAAGALAAAHHAGIVHRDVKPENIMIRPDGYIKVLDFGLAKLREQWSSENPLSLTASGVVMGTARYMSPEQARGQATDARSDLFSLGVVLYELLSGRRPFPGETPADTMVAVLNHEPDALDAAVPRKMRDTLEKCLCKDPAQRYQTCDDLAADLTALKQDLDSASGASAVAGLSRSGRWWRVALAAGAVALLAGAIYLVRPGGHRWYDTFRLTKITGIGQAAYGVLSADGKQIAYSATFPDGSRNLCVRTLATGTTMELLPRAAVSYYSLVFSPDGTQLYYVLHYAGRPAEANGLYRMSVGGGRGEKLLENIAGGTVFSPDGKKLAFVRRAAAGGLGGSRLITVDPDGSGEKEVYRGTDEFALQTFAWSADGREIVFPQQLRTQQGISTSLLSVSRDSGPPRMLAKLGRIFVYSLASLPDGTGFLVNMMDVESGLAQIWIVAKDGAARHVTNDLASYVALSASRDGRKILTTQPNRRSSLWVVDRDNPGSAHMITEPAARYDHPIWLHDGHIAAELSDAGKSNLWVMAPDGRGGRLLLANSPEFDIDLDTCPDRDDLVFSSRRNGVRNIWRVRQDGTGEKQLTSVSYAQFPQCVAGGSVIYRSTVNQQIIAQQVSLDGGPSSPSPISWDQRVSPDGKLILARFRDEVTSGDRVSIRTRREGGW